MSFDKTLAQLQININEIFAASIADEKLSQLRNSFGQSLTDLEACVSTISSRPEHLVFDLSIRQLEFSMLAGMIGSYRQAMSSLRLAFELWLAAIQFSLSETEFREWKIGTRDIKWSNLIDDENGVLSTKIARLFFKESAQTVQQINHAARHLYRICSQFVHGNPNSDDAIPKFLSYDREALSMWLSSAKQFEGIAIFIFAMRYQDGWTPEQNESVEAIIKENIGHISEMRQLVGGPTGG